MNKLYSIIILILFYSCVNKNEPYLKTIEGDWKLVGEGNTIEFKVDTNLHFSDGNGFLSSGICEHKGGYFSIDSLWKRHLKPLQFLGTKTTYQISNDSLKIFDLSLREWQSKKIIKLISDTLIVQKNDTLFQYYMKQNYANIKEPDFDQVIVSSYGCLGRCPNNNISIKRNGEVLYYGIVSNTKNGFYKSSIKKETFDSLAMNFKHARYSSLNEQYYRPALDGQSISVSFLKNNKIIKTINDYCWTSPAEFQWAFTPVIFFYQQMSLDTVEVPTYLTLEFEGIQLTSSEGGVMHYLTPKSEIFYLLTLLRQGKVCKKEFKSDYAIPYTLSTGEQRYIKTDGQYYIVPMQDGKEMCIDIGKNLFSEIMRRGETSVKPIKFIPPPI